MQLSMDIAVVFCSPIPLSFAKSSVGVFSLLGLKLRVIFIRVYWASLNAQEAFFSFLLGRKKGLLGLLKKGVK